MKTHFTLGAFRLHFMPDCYNATSGYADNCYTQPFDASTVCTMYRILESKSNSSDSSSSVSPLIWAGIGLASGGTLLLAYLAVRYLVKPCKKPARNNDDYNELSEINPQTLRPKV